MRGCSKTKKGGCWSGNGKKRTRKVKGGSYGFGAAITPGALEVVGSRDAPVDPKTGAEIPDATDPVRPVTGGRRRKSRGSRKSRKSRRRKMRGGAGDVSMGTVGYTFKGDGAGGIAGHSQYTTQGNAY
jgi:hypothetical protein